MKEHGGIPHSGLKAFGTVEPELRLELHTDPSYRTNLVRSPWLPFLPLDTTDYMVVANAPIPVTLLLLRPW